MKSIIQPSSDHTNRFINLHFFRHDEKGKLGENQWDYQVRLTEEGKQHSKQVWQEKWIDSEIAVGYHSPRERTKETLYHRLNLPGVEVNQSLEEIDEKVSQHFQIGKKAQQNSRLNFYLGGEKKSDLEKEFNEEAYKHFNGGGYSFWVMEESDRWFKKLNDIRISSYSKVAGDFAEIVQKYFRILTNKVKNTDTGRKKADWTVTYELQRLFANHGEVGELFLMKIIEKDKWKKYLKDFIIKYFPKWYFDYSEGFEIEIGEYNLHEVKMILKYEKEEFKISPQMLKEMVEERDNLYSYINIPSK